MTVVDDSSEEVRRLVTNNLYDGSVGSTDKVGIHDRQRTIAPPAEHPIHPSPVVADDYRPVGRVPQNVSRLTVHAHPAAAHVHEHASGKVEEQEADQGHVSST